MWASQYDCAIVLVGHLNKKSSSKELYRGLGSIDVAATARSVLQIDSFKGIHYDLGSPVYDNGVFGNNNADNAVLAIDS